mgnify:CR=1 FL=1
MPQRATGRSGGGRGAPAAAPPTPRRARSGTNVTQMHYARKGIVTPEMEYIAIRENQRIEAIREAVAKEIADGIEFAKASPSPEIRNLERYVYTETV